MDSAAEARPPIWARISLFLSLITVEPVFFFNELAKSLEGKSFQKFSLDKICLNTLHQPEAICANVTAHQEVNKQFQDVEADYVMYRSFLTHIPLIVVSLCMGSWSDRHNRKIPMLISKIGIAVQSIFLLVNAVFMNWPAEMLFIYSAIAGFTGSNLVFYALALSYIAERTKAKHRIWRFGLLEAFKFAAYPIGTMASGYINESWGYVPIFATSSGLRILCILYLAIRLQSLTVNPSNVMPLPGSKWRDFFNWKHFLECGRTCIKNRAGHNRRWILLILLANWTMSIPGFGEGGIDLMYFTYFRKWSFIQYTNYSSLGTTLAVISLLTLMPLLTHVIQLSNPVMELLGNAARILHPLIVCFSTEDWCLWAAHSLTPLYPFSYPAMTSMLTQLVDKDEIGKVLSIKCSSEMIIPLFSNVIYAQVYQHTMTSFPGAFLLLTASFNIVSAIAFIYILLDAFRLADWKRFIGRFSIKQHYCDS